MFFHSRDISPFPAIQLRLSYDDDDDDGDDGMVVLRSTLIGKRDFAHSVYFG
jgi:hypothetical protein